MKSKKRNKQNWTPEERRWIVQAKCSLTTPRKEALQVNMLSNKPRLLQLILLQKLLPCLTLKLSARIKRKRNEIKLFKIVYKYKS